MTRSNRENQRNQPPSKTSGHYQLFCVLCNLCTGAGTGSTWRAFCWTIGQSKHHGFPKTMQITDYQVFPERDQKVRKPSKQYKRPWTLHATRWSQSASSLYDRMKRRRLQRPWRPRKKPASLGALLESRFVYRTFNWYVGWDVHSNNEKNILDDGNPGDTPQQTISYNLELHVIASHHETRLCLSGKLGYIYCK